VPSSLTADFERRFPRGPVIQGQLRTPLDGFSVTVLFGPSGSGETTVLRCLAGLERPDPGQIRFGAETWFDTAAGVHLPPQRRGVGYLAQDYALLPHLTVAGNIGYGLVGLDATERQRRIDEMVRLFGLTGLERRYPRQVSGGQQQRVALARALARRRRLLLLDEPLSALDVPTREQLRRELRRLLAGLRVPALLVTHDRTEALALGDFVAILEEAIQIFKTARFEMGAAPLGPTDRDVTDAHYHLRRIQLAASTRSAADLLKWVPEEFAQGLHTVLERCAGAERCEREGEAARARSLWQDVLNSSRRLLWTASSSAPVSGQLEMARQMRPAFDRYLSWAGRTKLSEQEVSSAYGTLCNLKGAVFIHQRRLWAERRHPWLRPFFDVLGEVNRKLARPDGSGEAAARAARSLLACKLALEAELGRRHQKLPQFQPAPPSVLLPPGAVRVDYLVYQDFALSGAGAAARAPEPRLACFLSRQKAPVVRVDLGPLAPVAKAVTQWRRAIQARGGGHVRGMVREIPELEEGDLPQFALHKQLWEPLQPHLDKAEVVLVPPRAPASSRRWKWKRWTWPRRNWWSSPPARPDWATPWWERESWGFSGRSRRPVSRRRSPACGRSPTMPRRR
jgi:ABC-type nitrate/sulfonate/bicarbonate transport system ATPase subunit